MAAASAGYQAPAGDMLYPKYPAEVAQPPPCSVIWTSHGPDLPKLLEADCCITPYIMQQSVPHASAGVGHRRSCEQRILEFGSCVRTRRATLLGAVDGVFGGVLHEYLTDVGQLTGNAA